MSKQHKAGSELTNAAACKQAGHVLALYYYTTDAFSNSLKTPFVNAGMEMSARLAQRPESGTVPDSTLEAQSDRDAMLYIAGVAGVLVKQKSEPASGQEPPDSLDWEIASLLIGRFVPLGGNGEFFHARMRLYRRASRLIRHFQPAFDAIATQLDAGNQVTRADFEREIKKQRQPKTVVQQPVDRTQLAATFLGEGLSY